MSCRLILQLRPDLEARVIRSLPCGVSVERRAGDWVEALGVALALGVDLLVAEDDPAIDRHEIAQLAKIGCRLVLICGPDRVGPLRQIGAELAMPQPSAAAIASAIEALMAGGLPDGGDTPTTKREASSQARDTRQEQESSFAEASATGAPSALGADSSVGEQLLDAVGAGGVAAHLGDSGAEPRDVLGSGLPALEKPGAGGIPSRRSRRGDAGASARSAGAGAPKTVSASGMHSGRAPEGQGNQAQSASQLGGLVLVLGPTGGAGISTVALNLASEVAQRGRSVLLVDADLEAPSLSVLTGAMNQWAGIAVACTMAARGRLEREVIADLVQPLGQGSHLLSGLTAADRSDEVGPEDLAAVLKLALKMYDTVVVDLGGVGATDGNAEMVRQAVLELPHRLVTVGAATPVGVVRLVQLIQRVEPTLVALNMVSTVTCGSDSPAALGKLLKGQEVVTLPLSKVAPRSALRGVSLRAEGPSDQLTAAVSQLATRLVGQEPARHRFSLCRKHARI